MTVDNAAFKMWFENSDFDQNTIHKYTSNIDVSTKIDSLLCGGPGPWYKGRLATLEILNPVIKNWTDGLKLCQRREGSHLYNVILHT